MRVRRDQLVLGAVAAALLVAIVAFAASSSGVKTAPATPTPTATPASERALFGGSLEPRVRYRTRAFEPALSFVVGDTEWLVANATQPDYLRLERRLRTGEPGGELPARSALAFSRIFQVIDPETGRRLYVDDLHAWLRQHPDLDVGPARPLTVGDRRGEMFDIAVRFRRPARASPHCQAQLIVCTAIGPDTFYPDGVRMRWIVLPAATAPLVIEIAGTTQRDLDDIEAPAAEVLRTLRVSAR